MSDVLSYCSSFFSWLGGFTTLLTNNVVIATLIMLVVAIPLIISLIRRYIL